MKKTKVDLGAESYEIMIGSGILAQAGKRLKEAGFSGKAVVITNPTVRGLYGAVLEESLMASGFLAEVLEVPDGEAHKSLENAGKLYVKLVNCYAERKTPILALGGGVIGDLGGFVAATYLRGVPLVHIPTTLLAQVDSSIGGKVAVNHVSLKNEIGAFYQPGMVISDIGTLKTLPLETLSDGMAEVIKHGVIRDKVFFGYLEENMENIRALDDGALEHIVFRSAEIKAEVVSEDEKDSGLRAILNYGHTVAHAVESLSDFSINHGSAVGIGMVAAAGISREMGLLEPNEVNRMVSLIKRAGLPVKIPNFDMDELVLAMKHDKKVLKGRIRFVLLKGLGEVFVTDEVDLSLVKGVLNRLK